MSTYEYSDAHYLRYGDGVGIVEEQVRVQVEGFFPSHPIYLSWGIHRLSPVPVPLSILRRSVDPQNRVLRSLRPGKRIRAVIENKLPAKAYVSRISMKNLWVAAPHPKYSILFTKSTPWLVPCSAGTRTSSPFLPRIMVVDSSRAAWHKHRWWSLRRGNISAPPSGEGECAGNYPCNFSNTNCLSLASYLSIPHRYCYLPIAPSPITTHHYLVFACIVIVYALHPRWSICIIY